MLTIFVRHTKRCLGDPAKGIAGLLDKQLSPEKLRGYKHCQCPKWYSGTHEGVYHPRLTLDANSWAEAEKRLEIVKAGEQQKDNVTVERAVREWLEEVVVNEVAPSTLEQWTMMGEKLKKFCERHNLRYISQVDAAKINTWRAEWKTERNHLNLHRPVPGIRDSTAKCRLAILRVLFQFVRRMRWVKEDPMSFVLVRQKRRGKTHDENGDKARRVTLPVDTERGDKKYRALLEEIEVNPEYQKRRAYLSAIVQLMYETGLRVSDAIVFRVDEMRVDPKDGWATYTTEQTKTHNNVTVAIPPDLVKVLQEIPRLSPKYIFYTGSSKLKTFYRAHIYGPLRAAGEAAGIPGMHPHRLRDSFAVNRLNEGMMMHEVSKLLGHASVAMTEKYYAPFVQSREDAIMARRKVHYGAAGKVVTIRKRAG